MIHQRPQGKELVITYEVITNQYEGKDNFFAKININNQSNFPWGKGWKIYFNFIRKIHENTVTDGFIIRHINGDFYCLAPAPNFKGIESGDNVDIYFSAMYWSIKYIEKPSGFFIVYQEENGQETKPQSLAEPSVLPFASENQTKRTHKDKVQVPTLESRYDAGAPLSFISREDLCPILPKPKFFEKKQGHLTISDECSIHFINIDNEYRSYILGWLASGYYLNFATGNPERSDINIELDERWASSVSPSKETYQIEIDQNGISIKSNTEQGIYYGIQSLRMLIFSSYQINNKTIHLPFCLIEDYPDLSYRGLHIDVARNFHKAEMIKKMIQIMGLFKINTLHFHLTDDEGWRLEIPGLPELTTITGRRGYAEDESLCLFPSYSSGFDYEDDDNPGNGYYSKSDFIELIRFAAIHQVTIIPEIDMPGHARAAIKAMEARYNALMKKGLTDEAERYLLSERNDTSIYESVQMWHDNVVNAALPSTYHFIEKVVLEIKLMFEEAGQKLEYIHIGGDEVPVGAWTQSPACRTLAEDLKNTETPDIKDYFLHKVYTMLKSYDIRICGWEETVMGHSQTKKWINTFWADKGIIPFCWNTIWGDGGETFPYQLINKGYDTVLCNAPSLYFDMAYDSDPGEDGFYWAGFNDLQDTFRFLPFEFYKSATNTSLGDKIYPPEMYKDAPCIDQKFSHRLLGIQGQLWSETLTSAERLEYMMLPRLLALAERAWNANPPWADPENDKINEKSFSEDWNIFSNQISQISLPFLERLFPKTNYRIPSPGIKIKDNKLYANTLYPGYEIRYTTDGSDPDKNSPLYLQPLEVDFDSIKMCTMSPAGYKSQVITKTYIPNQN